MEGQMNAHEAQAVSAAAVTGQQMVNLRKYADDMIREAAQRGDTSVTFASPFGKLDGKPVGEEQESTLWEMLRQDGYKAEPSMFPIHSPTVTVSW
jgi:hypothetical protein